MKSNKKAFTLIELLVVIAIIGILATISVLALSNARAKSRDAKRAGDIKQVQTALELFFNDNNRYPTTEEWNTGKIYSTTTGATSTYMQIIPTAPTPADGTCGDKNTITYTPSSDWASYNISFCLGNTTGTLTPGPKCLTPGGIVDVDCSPEEAPAFACGDSVTYEGESYPTVSISTQCWFAKNLNIGTYVTGATAQTNNSVIEKYCYGDSTTNCATYGGLYQWDEAMQYTETASAQGICPTGWHIPTDDQQDILDQYLKDSGQTCNADRSGWDCDTAGSKLSLATLNGNNSSGFTGLLAGSRDTNGSFYDQGSYAHFWSSSFSGSTAWLRVLGSGFSTVYRYASDQANGFSVRCLKD